jgi:predicted RNA-binding protein
MEDVLLIKIEGNQIHLTDILNQKKLVKGHITEINLDKHGIYIEMEK